MSHTKRRLIAKFGKGRIDGLELLGLGLGAGLLLLQGLDLVLVVDGTLSLALLLELGQHSLVLPADLVGEAAQSAKVATGLEAEDAQGGRDDHALHRVVRLGDALKDLEALHGGGTARRLVGQHAADGAEKDARGRTVMEGTVGGVGERTLAQKLAVLYYSVGGQS